MTIPIVSIFLIIIKSNNTQVTFRAKIIEIYPSNYTILASSVEYPYLLIEIKSNAITDQLQKNDIIFVVGILKGEHLVFAEKIFEKGPWDDYTIFVDSIPAIPFVLFLFFRSWRFNTEKFSFERREKNA